MVLQATAIRATGLHHLQQMGDFCDWQQQEKYQHALRRLISHLNAGV